MLLICSNGLSKASKKVFKATPHSLIPFSSARAARTEHHDPSSATDQGQNLEISQVLRQIMASTFSLTLEEIQLQVKNTFSSASLVN